MLQGQYLLSCNVTVGFCHFPWLPCTRLLQLSGWLFLGSSPTPRALTCTPVWLGFLLGCTLEKWLLFPHLSQYLPLAGPRPPYGWAWFPHPVQPNLVAGLPVLFLGLLFIILYRPGLVTLFISLPSFSFRCSPSCHLPWSHFLAWLFQTLWAVSRTDFRSAIFQINFLCSSLLPFFITASTMIVFSIVIGNSQLSPCSLQFSSKSACGKSAGHLMLKSLYYSKVMFQCALTWLFNFWACDLQFIGSSGTVSIIFWRSSPPTNSNWLLMEICTPQFLWKYSTGLKLIKLIRRTHWHPSSCSLKLISP